MEPPKPPSESRVTSTSGKARLASPPPSGLLRDQDGTPEASPPPEPKTITTRSYPSRRSNANSRVPSAVPSEPPLISGAAVNGASVVSVPPSEVFSCRVSPPDVSSPVPVPCSSRPAWAQPAARRISNTSIQTATWRALKPHLPDRRRTAPRPTLEAKEPSGTRAGPLASPSHEGSVVQDIVHVLVPVPVGTRVVVIVRIRDFDVPHYVISIYRYQVLVAQVSRKPGRGVVHGLGKPLGVGDVSLVLDAYARLVIVPVSRVPADVLLTNRLPYKAVRGTHRVMSRNEERRVLEPVESTRPGALSDVDDDLVYKGGVWAVRRRIVVRVRREVDEIRVVYSGH